jgi:hypothetical protein
MKNKQKIPAWSLLRWFVCGENYIWDLTDSGRLGWEKQARVELLFSDNFYRLWWPPNVPMCAGR